MQKLRREDLYSLEQYAEKRPQMRADVMRHKKPRQVPIGPNATLYFEDRITLQYQIQEMLRVEKIFEAEGIQDELDAYNPLIPDGSNLKATFMLEYPDADERRRELARLIGIEDVVWLKVDDHPKVMPIADEDLERETEEKTSSVHFLRFEFTPEMIESLKGGAMLSAGIDHENYRHEVSPLPAETVRALTADFD